MYTDGNMLRPAGVDAGPGSILRPTTLYQQSGDRCVAVSACPNAPRPIANTVSCCLIEYILPIQLLLEEMNVVQVSVPGSEVRRFEGPVSAQLVISAIAGNAGGSIREEGTGLERVGNNLLEAGLQYTYVPPVGRQHFV